jgi:uncharacterized protein
VVIISEWLKESRRVGRKCVYGKPYRGFESLPLCKFIPFSGILYFYHSMYTKAQILNILKTQKKELEKRYPISELGLFGSYANGDNTEYSDIDILVDFNNPVDAYTYIRLAHELEDRFKAKIDLVSRKGIKPHYLPYVEKSLIHV